MDECMHGGEGWYHVQHEKREEQGGEYEELCDERVRRAREEYETRIRWSESSSGDEDENEVQGEEDRDGDNQRDDSELEWEDEIQTPTVAASESLSDKESASLGPKISAIGLDGLSI